MRKFRFKLESVEKARKVAEEQCLRVLADSQKKYREAVASKQELMEALLNALKRREELGSETVSIVPFQLENDFIAGTKQRIGAAELAIVRATKGVEKSLRSYLNARRKTRTVEVLREKAYQEYKKTARKREQKELDDLSTMRAQWKSEDQR